MSFFESNSIPALKILASIFQRRTALHAKDYDLSLESELGKLNLFLEYKSFINILIHTLAI
jgi:hypothetical protein